MAEARGRPASVEEWAAEMRSLINKALLSTRKPDIARAMKRLTCMVRGKCVCDMCDTWDPDVHMVYELHRCFLSPRTMQLIKEAHIRKPRWEGYVRGLYKELFDAVYEDISPSTSLLSNGEMELGPCPAEFSREDAVAALAKIQAIARAGSRRGGQRGGHGHLL